jgi:CubicO group peptidase (beta-lactamase class C family)
MHRNAYLLTLAGAVLTFALLLAAEPGGKDDIKPVIDKLADPLVRDKKGVGLVVGVLTKQGRQVFGFGALTLDGDRPPDRATLFEIGSITKVFTALLLALLGQDGLVRLDDQVQLYLPEGVTLAKKGEQEITLRHLATHTSGLPRMPANFLPAILRDADNPYAHYTEKQLYVAVADLKPARPAGEKGEYSNLGMGLLGHLLVRKAGAKSYEDLVVRRVCDPLGMKDTRVTLSDGQKQRLAPGHKKAGKPTPHWTFASLQGAGALLSTADDMLYFVEANVGLRKNKLAAALAACQKIEPVPGGDQQRPLGWQTRKLGDRQALWHNGGTYGFHSFVGFVRDTQTGVVVLYNCGEPGRDVDQLGFDVLAALNGERKKEVGGSGR